MKEFAIEYCDDVSLLKVENSVKRRKRQRSKMSAGKGFESIITWLVGGYTSQEDGIVITCGHNE